MRMWSRPCASRGVKDAARMEKRGGGQVSGGMENFQGLGPGMYACVQVHVGLTLQTLLRAIFATIVFYPPLRNLIAFDLFVLELHLN